MLSLHNMSVTLHYSQIREPDLLDVVDDAWAQDKLPNDGNSSREPLVCLLITCYMEA